jgi:hypothetical protein
MLACQQEADAEAYKERRGEGCDEGEETEAAWLIHVGMKEG